MSNGTFEDLLKKSKQKSQPRNVELIKASDVIVKQKEWLWRGHLLRGALELLSGLPGLGKSQVQIALVACITSGLPWPDGADGMDPANVIMLTAEDTIDQEVIPRLKAAGADLNRVHILKCIKSDNKDRQFLLAEDLEALERKIIEIGNVALITIDPITAYMGGTIDSHKTTEVRSQLGPLKDFSERANVAISAITHPPKSSSPKAINHFIGSQAFIAAGRIGHVCVEEIADDGGKTGRILFTHAKHNPSVRMPTLAYQIEETTVVVNVDTFPIHIPAPHVVWAKDSVDITADEAVRAAAGADAANDRQQSQQQDAVRDFLRDLLKDGQPIFVNEIRAAGAKLGFSKDQLDRAKRKLKAISIQTAGAWQWQIISF
ncbi:AAA family ATPase [Bradyrhizobium sp. URHC0002]